LTYYHHLSPTDHLLSTNKARNITMWRVSKFNKSLYPAIEYKIEALINFEAL